MSITEILPAVRALPRSEKFRLARLLLDDLAEEELLSTIKPGQEFPLYTHIPHLRLNIRRCWSETRSNDSSFI
jgi:hypothetical protein